MADTPTIFAHDDIPVTIVLHGLPFLWHIQQTLSNVRPPITSTSSHSSPDVAAFLLAYHGLKRYVPASRCGNHDSIAVMPTWGLWYTKWHWVKFPSVYFGFPLSLSFHQCFIRFFIYHPHYIIFINWPRRKTTPLTNLSLSMQYMDAKTLHKDCHSSQNIKVSWFQTFAVFCMLYVFFWVIPRRLKFICRRFGTLFQSSQACLWRWNRVFRNVGI
jgi:hypothetical protein